MKTMRTQVGIVGAGPAGLMLGHLLHLAGIDSVIIENRAQDYVIERVRAGVLEHATVDLLIQSGVGTRVQREGLFHVRIYEREYPFAWLGILASAPPSSPELVYSLHHHGFALFSMRSNAVTRLYLQCAPDEDLSQWPDDRIWEELLTRLQSNDGWKPNVGPITQKGVTGMRSFVAEPMRYERMFLAGDAA